MQTQMRLRYSLWSLDIVKPNLFRLYFFIAAHIAKIVQSMLSNEIGNLYNLDNNKEIQRCRIIALFNPFSMCDEIKYV